MFQALKLKFGAPESVASESAISSSVLDKVSYVVLLATVFLAPIFFIPSPALTLSFSKQIIIAVGIIIALVLWLIDRLKKGELTLPGSYLYFTSLLVVGATALSVVFSSNTELSFVGFGIEPGTLLSIVLMVVAMLLVPAVANTRGRLFSFLSIFLLSWAIAALYQLVRVLFGTDALTFGLFVESTSNIVGKWNDFGILSGLAALVILSALELMHLRKSRSVLLGLGLLVSLFFLALVNFTTVWTILAIASLILIVYVFTFAKKASGDTVGGRTFPVYAVVVFVIAAFFLLAGTRISGLMNNAFNISHLDLRPSWSSTIDIAKNTLKDDPLFGAGANRFVGQWNKYKPIETNNTSFWNVDFAYGIGSLPTFAVTTGIVGVLSWIIFLVYLLLLGLRSVLAPVKDVSLRALTMTSLAGSIFLWTMLIFYVPNISIIILAFVFTGIFLGASSLEGVISRRRISYTDDPKVSFVSVLVLMAFLIGGVSAGYVAVEKFGAVLYQGKAVLAANRDGNVDKAEDYLVSSLQFDEQDGAYRMLAEINLAKMNAAAQSNGTEETVRNQVGTYFSQALAASDAAVAIDANNHANWLSRGRVYESIVTIEAAAYEKSKESYEKALALSPHNPEIYLTLGRLELSRNSLPKAREYIAKAIEKKSNYAEAAFMLAQVQIREGNTAAAIQSVEAASVISPQDPSIFFQLGLLKYNQQDFKGAVQALERAVLLNDVFANARYFLGLSYFRVGQKDEAIKQFEKVQATNPGNEEVNDILKNLRAGKSPFTNAPATAARPERRTTPPVKETQGTQQ